MDILNKLQTGLKLNYNNMEDSTNKKNSFWIRKVSIWHIIYLIVIALIIQIFLLCIVPGKINDDAYQNFSFAATITSIVLAVVSIVYSLQSGLSSIGQLNSIKEIESRIGNELTKFSTIEATITKAVKEGISPLEASMGNFQRSQDDIQKSQEEQKSNRDSVIESISENKPDNISNTDDTSVKGLALPHIFYVILYTCLKSKIKGKDIPFHILRRFFGVRVNYCEGVIRSISIFNSQRLTLKKGSKPTRIAVDSFDTDVLGDESLLRKQVLDGKNKKLGEDIIQALDEYYDATVDDKCEVL